MSRTVLLSVLILISVGATGQTQAPAISALAGVSLTPEEEITAAASLPAPQPARRSAAEPRRSDTPAWIGFAATLAANVADIETAQSCIRAHTCSEGNPLVANRALGYGLGVSLDTLGFLAARAQHRQHHKVWVLPAIMGVGYHAVGIVLNERAAARGRSLWNAAASHR
jgi:hypothetical protein